MTKANRIGALSAIGAVATATVLSGCAYGPELATPIVRVPNERLSFYGVRAYKTTRGVLVT